MAGESSAEKIVDDYRALVDRLKLSPQEILDEKDLPHPRQRIIDALLAEYSLSAESSHSPAQLQGWLITLAQFQPNVGEPILDPAAETARRMTAGGRTVSGEDLQKISEDIADESVEEHWSVRRAKFQVNVDRERSRLMGLLQDVR